MLFMFEFLLKASLIVRYIVEALAHKLPKGMASTEYDVRK